MSVFRKLKIRETELSKLLEENKEKFESLFNLMFSSDPVRLLFLSNLEKIKRKEEPPKPMVTDLKVILTKEGIEESKAEKIVKEIAEKISVSIAERRAVSARSGDLGLIEPFEIGKVKLEIIPSVGHIYGSYFSNFVSVLEVLRDFGIDITPNDIGDAYRACQNTGIMTNTEKFLLCEECGLFRCEEDSPDLNKCPHEKIRLLLFQLAREILEAWNRGAILCGYFAHALKQDGWNTLVECEVQGTGEMWHQIDVIAEKYDLVLLCECKQSHPTYALSKDEVMKALGIMEDLERIIHGTFSNKEIRKIVVTTSTFDKRIHGIKSREDILLIDKNDILVEPKSWREKIYRSKE